MRKQIRITTLGEGGIFESGNTVPIKTTADLKKYLEDSGSTHYNDGTIYDLKDNTFNLTSSINIKKSYGITGGIIKAENLDYFFNIESPANKGPTNVFIKNTKFIITKEQDVVFAKGVEQGEPLVLNIAGITLENITFEIVDGIDASKVTLLHIDKMPINNAVSNEITISNNNLNGASSINIANPMTSGDIHYDATEINYPVVKKYTYIALNSDIGRYVPTYVVDKSVGDSPIKFQFKLMDEDNQIVVNRTVTYALNGEMFTAITDQYGIATLNIYLSQPGTHFIYSQFTGDDEYFAANMEVNSIILRKKISTLAAKNLSYKVTATKKLSATFKSPVYDVFGNLIGYKTIKNKKVTFTVNGKTYTATTNSKGVATVKITLNKKGTYYYTAKFAGDSRYNAATKKAKLTIVPLATSLTAAKYSYKRTAKVKRLKTVLKSGKTVLKYQKVTFRVNGKNYVAKTNYR